MYKYPGLILVCAGILLIKPVFGAEVDTLTALTVARNFYETRAKQNTLKSGAQDQVGLDLTLVHVETMTGLKKAAGAQAFQQLPLYYIFEAHSEQGYVIVSGDDRVTPVLAYSLTGGFSGQKQPPALIDWMEQYSKQITRVVENQYVTDPVILERWRKLIQPPVTKSTAQVHEVLPLLTTVWSQECYYNEFCPSDPAGPCDHALVGCVALAMAQIMKYWNHPLAGNRIPGYDAGTDYGCIPAIGPASYDWNNMPDALYIYSQPGQVNAVAELLYHAGVSVSMDYGPDGSGAFSDDARNSLISYFNYSSTLQHLDRYSMDEQNWVQLIIDELEGQRPVYYTGSGSIGHAFVCDGYQDSTYFHFNWGWGGAFNGYFYLNDLTPGQDDFNNFQTAIVGITPEVETQSDPLDHIIDIDGTGSEHTETFSSGGAGAWDHQVCGSPTPGVEQLYQFVAQTTGYYSITVVSANGQMAYGWREAACAESGWECIGNLSSSGSFGSLPWTAGSTYYILLDDPDLSGNTHQFYITDPVASAPHVEYHRYDVDDDDLGGSDGDGDGQAEAGESVELSLVLINTGEFDAHAISAVLSTSDTYVTVTSNYSDYGDLSPQGGARSATPYLLDISSDCPEKEVTFNLAISSAEASWNEQFTIHVSLDIPLEPSLEYYGHQINDDDTGDGDGVLEQGETVEMQLSLLNTGDKEAHNGAAVITCADPDISISIDSVNFEIITINSTKASIEFYVFSVSADCPEKDVLFDLEIYSDEGSWTDSFIVHVNLSNPPLPNLEYFSHQIDDNTSNGDGDGIVERGETINIPITLRNTGETTAQNVSAVLSAADSDISVISEVNNYQDIGAGGSAQSSGNYVFEVAGNCREKDIAFTLEITSDEGTWTDQFLLHVSGPTSIFDETFITDIELYPNPTSGLLYLKTGIEINVPVEIRILDSQGRIVHQQSSLSFLSDEILEIDLKACSPGIHLMELRYSDKTEITKFVFVSH